MMPSLRLRLLVTVFLLGSAGTAFAQSQLPSLTVPWWKSDSVKKELSLSNDQAARIENIWQTAKPHLQSESDRLNRYEAQLSHLIETDADKVTVTLQIDKVEALRSTMSKERTLMLIDMRQLLTPDQRMKLNARYERWAQEQKERQGQQSPQQRGQPPPGPSRQGPLPQTSPVDPHQHRDQ